jgi:CBS domain-containing protein
MKVSDVMTTDVVTVTADTPLKQAAALMLEREISGMPVVDEEAVVGVLSVTDVLFKEHTRPEREGLVDWVVHYGEDPPATKLDARVVRDAMTTPPITIRSTRSVATAATLLLDLGVDRLPVVDGDELVGIVTRSDLLRAFARTDEEIADEIRTEAIPRAIRIEPDELVVAVTAGEVLIEGRVASEELVERIRAEVQQVPGVVSVEALVA